MIAGAAVLAACSSGLTPQQEWVMTTFEACKHETGVLNARLDRVEADGHFYATAAETQTEINWVVECMREKQNAERRRIADVEKRPGRIDSGLKATSIAFRTVGNAMIVSGTVNAAESVRLIVDTGATLTVLSPAAARRAGVHATPPLRTEIVTVMGGRTLTIPIARVRALRVGDALVEDLESGVFEATPHTPHVDGLLGSDFLRRFRLTVDKTEGRLTFEALPSPRATPARLKP